MSSPITPGSFDSDVTRRKSDIEGHITLLGKNASYWGDRNKTGLAMIELYTLSATIIMATNIALKENIQTLGGWVPFCLAATVLTACAAYIVNGQKSEQPSVNRLKSLEALMEFRALLRALQSTRDWTDVKLEEFDEKVARAESEYSLFLVSPPKLSLRFYAVMLFVLIIGSYLAYESFHLAGYDFNWMLRVAEPSGGK